MGHVVKNWKLRYFYLNGLKLLYYHKKEHMLSKFFFCDFYKMKLKFGSISIFANLPPKKNIKMENKPLE